MHKISITCNIFVYNNKIITYSRKLSLDNFSEMFSYRLKYILITFIDNNGLAWNFMKLF